MDSNRANMLVCSYFAYLRKTGDTSPCLIKKACILPLLVDLSGDKAASYRTEEDKAALDKLCATYPVFPVEDTLKINTNPSDCCQDIPPCADLMSQFQFDSIFN